MYKKINIQNFRGFRNITVDDFRQFNLIVGKNNSGKSTILESIFLSTAPSNLELSLRINAFRGYSIVDEMLWRLNFHGLNTDLDIMLSSQLRTRERRKLIIKPLKEHMFNINPDLSTNSNILKLKDITDAKSSYSENKKITGLTSEYTLKPVNGQKRIIKSKCSPKMGPNGPVLDFSMSEPTNESLKGVYLGNDNLIREIAPRFNEIQIKKEKKRIINVLRKIEPRLTDIILGNNGILYCDIGFDMYLPLNVMGDGIIRLLSYLLAIYDTSNGIVLIDEIENGFYHTSQEILWSAIFEAAKEFNVQIFATTHSIENILAFVSSYSKSSIKNKDIIKLYRVEKDNDDSNIVDYDSSLLDTSLIKKWEVR